MRWQDALRADSATLRDFLAYLSSEREMAVARLVKADDVIARATIQLLDGFKHQIEAEEREKEQHATYRAGFGGSIRADSH